MSYPSQSPEPWHPSLAEDYARADDETRRQILLQEGYDPDYYHEVLRLFGSPSPLKKSTDKDAPDKNPRKHKHWNVKIFDSPVDKGSAEKNIKIKRPAKQLVSDDYKAFAISVLAGLLVYFITSHF